MIRWGTSTWIEWMHIPKESLDKRTFSRPSTPNNSNLRCLLNRADSKVSWNPPSPQDLSWNWSLSRQVEDPHDTQGWHLRIRSNPFQASSLLRYLVIGPFLLEVAQHNAEHVQPHSCSVRFLQSGKSFQLEDSGKISDQDVDSSARDIQNVWAAMTIV